VKKVRVLVIDDSAIVRDKLASHLGKIEGIEVVGAAQDAYAAREMIADLHPDVLTLDLEMPRMNGLTFLKYLMKSYPLPVIIVSSLLQGQNELAMTALELGAVDLVPKPGGPFSIGNVIDLLGEKILAASYVNIQHLISNVELKKVRTSTDTSLSRFKTTGKLIAIGASTGGTIALEKIISEFPPAIPPVLVVIHMPQGFTRSFAERLDSLSICKVKEAEPGETVRPGTVYVAPGNNHLELKSRGTMHTLKVFMGPKIHSCRPAVDVLFKSVAAEVGKNALGIILTGMGRDGAEGLLEMKKAGALTVAQDETTSIVYGMPKEAVEAGAVGKILPLHKIVDYMEREFLKNS